MGGLPTSIKTGSIILTDNDTKMRFDLPDMQLSFTQIKCKEGLTVKMKPTLKSWLKVKWEMFKIKRKIKRIYKMCCKRNKKFNEQHDLRIDYEKGD